MHLVTEAFSGLLLLCSCLLCFLLEKARSWREVVAREAGFTLLRVAE